MIDAVAGGKVDAAVLWGPQAGYYARRYAGQLELTPTPARDSSSLPFEFSISMAVRKNEPQLRDRLTAALQRNKPEIDRILRSYAVPLVEGNNFDGNNGALQ
jgi:mxaJ protein